MFKLISTLFLVPRGNIFAGRTRHTLTSSSVKPNLEVAEWVANYANRFFCWNGAKKNYLKDSVTTPGRRDKGEHLSSNVMDAENSEKIRVLHLGEIPSSFKYSDSFFDATYIPHDTSYSDLCGGIGAFGKQSFDMVCLSFVLSTMSDPEQRLQLIKLSRDVIRNPGYGNKHPHRVGILCILEHDEVFIDENENTSVITGRGPLRRSYNKELLSDWKDIIRHHRFENLKYRTIAVSEEDDCVHKEASITHAFVFKAAAAATGRNIRLEYDDNNLQQISGNTALLSFEPHCGRGEGRKSFLEVHIHCPSCGL